MGQFKQRLTTTVSADLINWRLRENGCIEGTIYDSVDKDYYDGERLIFKNTILTHWPYAHGFWPDHFLLETQTGKYFMLKDCDRDKS
jgi:hypothetical protein